MKRRNRWVAVLILIAGSWWLTAAASADQETKGFGIVMSRDLAASTLEIGDRVYRVTPRTTFKNKDGLLTSFEALDIFDVHQGLFSLDDATKVAFVSVSTADGPELRSVVVVAELPL